MLQGLRRSSSRSYVLVGTLCYYCVVKKRARNNGATKESPTTVGDSDARVAGGVEKNVESEDDGGARKSPSHSL